MKYEIDLTEDQAETLDNLLALAEDATEPANAIYLDDESAEKVTNLREALKEQVAADTAEVTL